jgi:HK97 family phage portal protein
LPGLRPSRLRTLWRSLLRLRSDFMSDLRHPTAWLSDWTLWGRTSAGIDISPYSVMTLPAYYAALRAISEDVGKLPLMTYERLEPRGKRRATEHSLYPVLHDSPNPLMSAMTWRESMTHYALAWGNAYAEIIRVGGQIVGLSRPIHPSRVTPKFDESGDLVYDVHIGDLSIPSLRPEFGQTITLPQRDVLHLRGLGDGLIGYSVAQLAAESLGLSLAAQQYGASFFGSGTHTGGIFTHPATLSDTAIAHLRDSLDKYRIGGENAMKTMVLEEGMTYERGSIPPNDAQFLETRQFQVTEVCRWFRIPPHKIGYLENATFSNIEHQGLEYVVDTLQPWLVRWEQELKRKLFADEPAYFAEHLVLGLLRGDQQARSNYYRTRFYIGSMSPNDIRELENENPILDVDGDPDPAGDKYYIQNNLATLDAIASRTTVAPTPGGAFPQDVDEAPEDEDAPDEEQLPGRNGRSNGVHH